MVSKFVGKFWYCSIAFTVKTFIVAPLYRFTNVMNNTLRALRSNLEPNNCRMAKATYFNNSFGLKYEFSKILEKINLNHLGLYLFCIFIK